MSEFQNIYFASRMSSQLTSKAQLFECFMSFAFSRRTSRLAFPFTRTHFVFLFCGNITYFSFNGM